MKRLIIGVAAFGFLAFVGVQTVHSHPGKAPESCQTCALGAQSLRHAPEASPAVVAASTLESLYEKPAAHPRTHQHSEASARAPPPAPPA